MNQLPTITKNLLIINVLCFFGTIVARRYGIDLESMFGLQKVMTLPIFIFWRQQLPHWS